MYQASEVLLRLDSCLWPILLFTAIAWTTGFIQIVEAVRLGHRDQVPGAPVGMTMFLLAHDSSFFLRYHHWFKEIGNWYFELFWYGMGVSVLIEIYLLTQFIRLGRARLAPALSFGTFLAIILTFQIAAWAVLLWLQSLLQDPLYLVSLVGTQVAAVIFNLPLLLLRGSTAGQSRLFAWATLIGPGSLALGLFPALLPRLFMTTSYAMLCLSTTALSLWYILLLRKVQARESLGPQSP